MNLDAWFGAIHLNRMYRKKRKLELPSNRKDISNENFYFIYIITKWVPNCGPGKKNVTRKLSMK